MAAGSLHRRRFAQAEGEPVGRLDADRSRDDDLLERAVARAEELLDGLDVDPARNLFGRRHRELVARDIRKAARLEFILERREFGLGALHDGVGAADREGFVAEFVKREGWYFWG